MKKFVAALCILLAVLTCAPTALAAVIKAETDPAQITSAGIVKIKFTITNDSAYEMSNLSLTGNGLSGQSQLSSLVIPSGGSQQFALTNVQVSEDMLGQTVVYTLTWIENGQQRSSEIPVTLGTAPAAEMTAARTADKPSGKKGDSIKLTYTLKNPGTAQMTNISVTDALAGNTPIKSGLTLDPGGSATVAYVYTMADADAVSAPTITYQVNGEDKTFSIDPLTIKFVSVQIDKNVVRSDPTPQGVTLTLTLTNSGNQAVSNIGVKDELGNAVSGGVFSLKAGESKELPYTVNPTELRNVVFYITGTDAQGQPYEDHTQSYEVWPYIDPSKVSLSFTATVLEPLSESGSMKVRFTIQNNSNVDMTGVELSESTLGTIETMDALPLGQKVLDKELLVGQPRELAFTLSAADPSGAKHDYQAKLTAAHVALATPSPAGATPGATAQPAGSTGMSSTLVTVLIVLAALMAIAGIALLALSIYERRRNATLEEEAEPEPPRSRAPRAQAKDAGYSLDDSPTLISATPGRYAKPGASSPADTRASGAEDDEPVKRYIPPAARNYAPQENRPYAPAPPAPQERPYIPPAVRQVQAPVPPRQPVQPRPPAENTRRAEPGPQEQKPPQASPEIRNRVHRVHRPEDDQ